MKLINCCCLIAISLAATKASVFGELGNNLLSVISKKDDSVEIKLRNIRREIPMKKYLHGSPIEDHVNKDGMQRNFAKAQTVSVNPEPKPVITKMPYKKDGVLNYVRRARDDTTASEETSRSSSRELVNWKTEWKNVWLGKKLEALNETDIHGGDKVNMVAARPWGVPCGDPYMHDMPWGSCMLPQECEAEFRIFRGDFKCGRTQFICCAVQLTSYDMYQAFDNSFASSDFGTDSWERKQRKNTKSKERRKKGRDKRKRKRERQKRKRRIKRNIKRIIKQIKKILNKINRQGTKQRKKKTRLLKKFIKHLKKRYKRERKSVKSIHLDWMNAIDDHTLNRLLKLKKLNQDFVKNNTFANIIVNGTINEALRDDYWIDRKWRERERKHRKKRIRKMLKKLKKALDYKQDHLYTDHENKKIRKTKLLQKLLYSIKTKYLEDRQSIKRIHDERMKIIDANTMHKLNQFGKLYEDFFKKNRYKDPIASLMNMTSVDVLRNLTVHENGQHTMGMQKERWERKKNSGRRRMAKEDDDPENLVYDIEYGFV